MKIVGIFSLASGVLLDYQKEGVTKVCVSG